MQVLQTNPWRTVLVYDSFPSLEIEGFSEDWFSFYFDESVPFEILRMEGLEFIPPDSLIFFGQVDGTSRTSEGCRNNLTAQLDALDVPHEAWFADQAFA